MSGVLSTRKSATQALGLFLSVCMQSTNLPTWSPWHTIDPLSTGSYCLTKIHFTSGLQWPKSAPSLRNTAPHPRDTCSSWHFFCVGFGCCVAAQHPWPSDILTHQNTNKYRQIQWIQLKRKEPNPTCRGCQLRVCMSSSQGSAHSHSFNTTLDGEVLKPIWSNLLIYCYLLCLILYPKPSAYVYIFNICLTYILMKERDFLQAEIQFRKLL